jgi:hypothetical protein
MTREELANRAVPAPPKSISMSKYVVVHNYPNRIATIHRADCLYLGANPLAQSASADRLPFDDGLEAIATAAQTTAATFCGHCLADYLNLITLGRKSKRA